MFHLVRDLKRILTPFHAPKDGLCGGQARRLELLDLNLLKAEARASDVAAGRISAADRPSLQIQQAAVWRELARRTGDAASLRKAAAAAEKAAAALSRSARPNVWVRARIEQALCAAEGAELFGDQGLNAAAERTLVEVAPLGRGLVRALAEATGALVRGRAVMSAGDEASVRRMAESFDRPLAQLEAAGPDGRLAAARARMDRADLMLGAAARLRHDEFATRAMADLARAGASVSEAYEPLTATRLARLRGHGLMLLGELSGDLLPLVQAAEALSQALEIAPEDHSPLDFARASLSLGQALKSVGDAAEDPDSFTQAAEHFQRAFVIARRQPELAGLRGLAALGKALCLVRRAELDCDLVSLKSAEAELRRELTAADPRFDPIAWGVRQLVLARLYEVRMTISGQDNGERAHAGLALAAALDVFADAGQKSLVEAAVAALARLRDHSAV